MLNSVLGTCRDCQGWRVRVSRLCGVASLRGPGNVRVRLVRYSKPNEVVDVHTVIKSFPIGFVRRVRILQP